MSVIDEIVDKVIPKGTFAFEPLKCEGDNCKNPPIYKCTYNQTRSVFNDKYEEEVVILCENAFKERFRF